MKESRLLVPPLLLRPLLLWPLLLRPLLLWPLLLCPLLLWGGCFDVALDDLAKEPPVKQRFLLGVESVAQAGATPAQAPVLLVEQAHALSPFNGRPFVYRTGENAHETDFYHEFLIPPAEQLSQITRKWLRDHRVFPQVIESDSPLIADALLTLDLTDLRGDLRQAERPIARMAIRASLLTAGTAGAARKVLFQKDYAADANVQGTGPAALVRGWNAATTEILGKLSADLRPFGSKPVGR
jgi:ABC-type uncharacterized transport system auxiliary subunit